jgi:hypothetical protein
MTCANALRVATYDMFIIDYIASFAYGYAKRPLLQQGAAIMP